MNSPISLRNLSFVFLESGSPDLCFDLEDKVDWFSLKNEQVLFASFRFPNYPSCLPKFLDFICNLTILRSPNWCYYCELLKVNVGIVECGIFKLNRENLWYLSLFIKYVNQYNIINRILTHPLFHFSHSIPPLLLDHSFYTPSSSHSIAP